MRSVPIYLLSFPLATKLGVFSLDSGSHLVLAQDPTVIWQGPVCLCQACPAEDPPSSCFPNSRDRRGPLTTPGCLSGASPSRSTELVEGAECLLLGTCAMSPQSSGLPWCTKEGLAASLPGTGDNLCNAQVCLLCIW